MKLVKTEDAVGMILCHDITQIIKGVTKDAVFRKGHIIGSEDIPVLLNCGKENVYVIDPGESGDGLTGGMIHENEAASFLCDICEGTGLKRGPVKEGKIELYAEFDGLLKIDEECVRLINSAGSMMVASRHGNFPVKAGDRIAGTRIIPLAIEEKKLLDVRDRICLAQRGRLTQSYHGADDEASVKKVYPLYNVLPFKTKKAAVIATGSEIQKGRIEDTFTPVIKTKLAEYDTQIVYEGLPGDDHVVITKMIMDAIKRCGADIVIVTGGMSVDPDDRTPLAIRNTGADIVCYGAPVLPGAMFMLGYLKRPEMGAAYESSDHTGIPVMGLPGCVMFHGRTIFDLVLPRVMADDTVRAEEIAALGTGGMCLNCEVCHFPNCGFGTGFRYS